MKLLRNLSLRNKLVFLLILPLAGLLYFQQKSILTEFEKKKDNDQRQIDIGNIERLSNLIYELQSESILAQSFSATNQQSLKDDLIIQRGKTENALDELHLTNQRNAAFEKDIVVPQDISSVRNPVNAFPQHAHDINLNLLNEISEIRLSIPNHEIKYRLHSFLTLLYGTEFLTQIRNFGIGFDREFSRKEYGDFSALKSKYEVNLDAFKKIASPGELNYFQTNFEHTPSVVRMNQRLDSILNILSPRTQKFDMKLWRTDITAAGSSLKRVKDFTLESIKNNLGEEAESIEANLIKKTGLSIALLALIITVAIMMIKDVVKSIKEINDATERIMKGDIDFAVHVKSNDELGQLAESFNKMITVLQDYIHIANSIGRGDYASEIKLRNDKDLLGRAFISMRDNLYNLSREKDTRTWLLKGNNELNEKLREEKDIRSLAQDIIIQIATYLGVQVGAIYLFENGQLNRVGSYALDSKSTPDTFAVGQSLIGQAALEKKPIIVDSVPPDYIRISSGLGSTVPGNIVVFPFLYVGKVKGVIELGSTKPFTPLDIEFLQVIGNSIAIGFNSSQSRSKLRELLEETQRQAEELESQQEELRQFNDELLEKILSIEKSEATLKVQQEELQQSNAELEEAANMLENEKQMLEKAKAIIETKAQNLESVSKYKSEFLANMSHELRTPLNSILILTQLLIENKNGTLNEKELKYANVIYNSGNELLTLINDILDLSKVESGRMELALDEITIGEIFSDMSMMFAQIAKSKSVNFKINASKLKNTVILTDKQRLEQILRNLLSNAFKFTPSKGSVTLSIYKVSPESDEYKNLRKAGEVIAFSVIDTGIGIQKDKQEIIFEAFRQVDSTDKRKFGGTGLGLSICRELSTLLGGEIKVQSEEGSGSTFTLYLPANYESPEKLSFDLMPFGNTAHKTLEHVIKEQEEAVDDDRLSVDDASRTILILEDDKEFAQVMLTFVRERNYKGIIAHQGNTGLSYARHYKPDAILLDMRLPVMDGEEVIRQLKSDPDLRHIPVQIISGYSREKEAMQLGAFNFIKKPVTKEDLQVVFERLEDFTSRKYKKLLIVEKNPEENKAMCELIGNGDVECFPTFSGNEAHQKLMTEHFDCIVVGIQLSDMSGIEFLERIKVDSQMNKIPIIVYASQDLTPEQHKKLSGLAKNVILKTAYSFERLLDETTLFLHRIESQMPMEKQNIIRKLHRTDEVLKHKTVLIVDDDMRNVYSLSNLLEEEGMECLTAENGREALEILNKNGAVDIILMDVMMPEMDGYEATSEIRKSGRFSKLPILALTAKAMKGDREKCLAVGMSDYITKPLDIGQLLSLMRVWLYNSE